MIQGASVVREDGTRGTVIAGKNTGQLVVEFTDGHRLFLTPDDLVLQQDGSYRFAAPETNKAGVGEEQIIIPVIAEELTVETVQVVRGRVHVRKRVESREELVDCPLVYEETVIEHVPVNKFVDGEAPQVREENGVLVIPMIEEVLVVEKRLLVREEVHVSKRRHTTSNPQTIILRREVVDIEREEVDDLEVPDDRQSR